MTAMDRGDSNGRDDDELLWIRLYRLDDGNIDLLALNSSDINREN